MEQPRYLKGIGGETVSTHIDWTAPKTPKRKHGRSDYDGVIIPPETAYEAKVKWEHGEKERKEKISSFIEKNDWEGLQKFLKKLLLYKKSWIRESMTFAQTQLLNKEYPDEINHLIKDALSSNKKKKKTN